MAQLDAWKGDFGTAYTERNVLDWQKRVPAFRQIVGDLGVGRVLEVGCNRGYNLLALSEVLGKDAEVVGIEPNPHARQKARESSAHIGVLGGSAFDLPFKDGAFDVVFTAGVLIHISLAELPKALAEIHRVSKRYVLAMEYFAEEETVIPYRGHDDLLWKRNFLGHYQTHFPKLRVVKKGNLQLDQGFDDVTWWLMDKKQG